MARSVPATLFGGRIRTSTVVLGAVFLVMLTIYLLLPEPASVTQRRTGVVPVAPRATSTARPTATATPSPSATPTPTVRATPPASPTAPASPRTTPSSPAATPRESASAGSEATPAAPAPQPTGSP